MIAGICFSPRLEEWMGIQMKRDWPDAVIVEVAGDG